MAKNGLPKKAELRLGVFRGEALIVDGFLFFLS